MRKYIQDIKMEFKSYNRNTLFKDMMAGLTVTAVALPLALAFGIASGSTASAGIITAIIAGIIIGGLSGASFQISGPTGAMSVILIVLVQNYGLSGVWIAGLLSGAILVILGILKFGKVVSYIPSPVITGFTSGIAIIIVIGQIDNFFGITSEYAGSNAVKIVNYFKFDFIPNWSSVFIAVIAILIMVAWPKKWNKIFPSSLASLILSLALSVFLKLNLEVIGDIPKTIILEDRLKLSSFDLISIQNLIIPAFTIAVLGMIESLLSGEVGSKMKGEKFNPNRELIAQGIGNIVIPFFGGVPATAAIARTSVGIKSGGVTRLTSVFHSVGILLVIFIFAPIMSKIPLASLSGVLIVTAWRMNDWDNIKVMISNKNRSAIIKFTITMIATVVFDLTTAIIIGFILACTLFIIKISNLEIVEKDVDENKLSGNNLLTTSNSFKDIKVIYLTGPLFFATVNKINKTLLKYNNNFTIILSMRGVSLIDTTGIMVLDEVVEELKEKNCTLMLSGLQNQVANALEQSQLIEKIGKENIFWSADQAISKAKNMNCA